MEGGGRVAQREGDKYGNSDLVTGVQTCYFMCFFFFKQKTAYEIHQ